MKFNASVVVTVLCLASCSEPKTVTVNNVEHGSYKVVVRDLEFLHSGIHNTDVCVTDLNDGDFPTTKGFQCFLKGYDFVGLTVSWRAPHVIDVRFKCGNVSSFSNFAIISKRKHMPENFHVFLQDQDSCK
jgi:hypothetical protein